MTDDELREMTDEQILGRIRWCEQTREDLAAQDKPILAGCVSTTLERLQAERRIRNAQAQAKGDAR